MKDATCILIVDDDSNILEGLDARLSASGFNVFKAADAQTAMQILKIEPVDLLISDMKMPVTSGLDLFLEIQKTLPELPVIFLTAYGTIPDAVPLVLRIILFLALILLICNPIPPAHFEI